MSSSGSSVEKLTFTFVPCPISWQLHQVQVHDLGQWTGRDEPGSEAGRDRLCPGRDRLCPGRGARTAFRPLIRGNCDGGGLCTREREKDAS